MSSSACVAFQGSWKDKIIRTSPHDSHVLETLQRLWPARIWVVFGRGLTCVWPGLGQGQAWARIPPLHSHIFVTAGQGRRLCYLRPGQIHSISHCASVSPGFPLWLATKEDDGEEKDRGACVNVCVSLFEQVCVCVRVLHSVYHSKNEQLKSECC